MPLVVDEPITPPSGTIMPLDDATIDRVAQSYSQLAETRQLQLGNVVATLREGMLLYPWQQYALTLINASIGDRPIYFASSGNAAASLGLNGYLVRQGLAFKLTNGLPEEVVEDVESMQGTPYQGVVGPWVDVPRTRTLVEDVFVHRSEIPDAWTHWPDQATIGIPNYYAWAYLSLAQVAAQRGDGDALATFQERAQAWTELGS